VATTCALCGATLLEGTQVYFGGVFESRCGVVERCLERQTRRLLTRIERAVQRLGVHVVLDFRRTPGGTAVDAWALQVVYDGNPILPSWRPSRREALLDLPGLLKPLFSQCNEIVRGGCTCTPGDEVWDATRDAFHQLLDLVGEVAELAGGIYPRRTA